MTTEVMTVAVANPHGLRVGTGRFRRRSRPYPWVRGRRRRRRRLRRAGRRRRRRAGRQWRRRQGRRLIADGGLKQHESARELGKFLSEGYLRRVGGDLLQRRRAHLISKAPREHGGAVSLDERRRVDSRLQQRLARRCVDRLLAVRDEQHDLSDNPNRGGRATVARPGETQGEGNPGRKRSSGQQRS